MSTQIYGYGSKLELAGNKFQRNQLDQLNISILMQIFLWFQSISKVLTSLLRFDDSGPVIRPKAEVPMSWKRQGINSEIGLEYKWILLKGFDIGKCDMVRHVCVEWGKLVLTIVTPMSIV